MAARPKVGNPQQRPRRLGVIEASDLTADKISRMRVLHCRFYDECLDHAMRRNWESWSCEACPVNELIDRPRLEREWEGLIDLAVTILAEDQNTERVIAQIDSGHGKPCKVNADTVRQMVRLHVEGYGASEIARQLGLHYGSVRYWLVKLGKVN